MNLAVMNIIGSLSTPNFEIKEVNNSYMVSVCDVEILMNEDQIVVSKGETSADYDPLYDDQVNEALYHIVTLLV